MSRSGRRCCASHALVRDQDNRVVERIRALYRPDQYEFEINLTLGQGPEGTLWRPIPGGLVEIGPFVSRLDLNWKQIGGILRVDPARFRWKKRGGKSAAVFFSGPRSVAGLARRKVTRASRRSR